MLTITLLQSGQADLVDAVVRENEFWVLSSDIGTALGWEVKPEGLCKDDLCIPLANRTDLIDEDLINLGRLSDLISRPLAISIVDRAASLGPPFDKYEQSVGLLQAPDFSLPDLDGRMYSLSEHRGSKVMIAAWASW
jgi:hypothetical protein